MRLEVRYFILFLLRTGACHLQVFSVGRGSVDFFFRPTSWVDSINMPRVATAEGIAVDYYSSFPGGCGSSPLSQRKR